MSAKPLFDGTAFENSTDLQIQFHLEAGHMCYFFYESSLARHHFDTALKLSGLSVELTGRSVFMLLLN